MKICLISGFALPTEAPLLKEYGGLEWICALLGYELAKLGHDVTIICSEGSNVPKCKLITPVSPRWTTDVEKLSFNNYSQIVDNFDIIHDHSHLKYILTKQFQTKIVCTFHDWDAVHSPPPFHADIYTCPSRAHAKHLEQRLRRKIETVHHGIPVEFFPFQKDKEDFLLFLARITPYKGSHKAVEFAKKTGYHLVIAGEDWNVESHEYVWWVMREAQKYGFEYLGRIDLETKLNLLKRAKALVLPYLPPYHCVFELTLIEAGACGTPVVISDRQSAEHEIIKHGKTGFIVKKVDEFPDYIKRLDEIDPRNCRKQVEEYFNSRRMAKDYFEIYKRIL